MEEESVREAAVEGHGRRLLARARNGAERKPSPAPPSGGHCRRTNGHARVCRDTTATFWLPPETKWLPYLAASPRDGDKATCCPFNQTSVIGRPEEDFPLPVGTRPTKDLVEPRRERPSRIPRSIRDRDEDYSSTRKGTFTRNHRRSSAELYRAKRRGGVIGTSDHVFDLQDAREAACAHTHTRAHKRAHAFSLRVDSYSIHGVNLSKAFASARESEYHLNALSIPACIRARA
ncbi:hypothetical protein PUN28_000684 [Cardiocondyla obscurior]|uniref:Uncharacterized protein n=1 Tax=Cardiocondyla obscurior TaxID=286306 RepID=A0AAW2H149_9HYME